MKELRELREEITAVDLEMAALFEKRMAVSQEIAAYKKEHGLPVYDAAREQENLKAAETRVPEEMVPLYRRFLQMNMDLSKEYQQKKQEE